MYKFILFFSSITFLYAGSNPVTMTLESILSNEMFLFRYANERYTCKVYGIWGLEKIYRNKTLNATCKRALEEFILHNPKDVHMARYVLHLQQRYRLEYKKGGSCVLYFNSPKSFSEVLLEHGLALLKPAFSDREFLYRFRSAQSIAQTQKRGIWSTPLLRSCISEFLKEQ